jgi:hypothetical protein
MNLTAQGENPIRDGRFRPIPAGSALAPKAALGPARPFDPAIGPMASARRIVQDLSLFGLDAPITLIARTRRRPPRLHPNWIITTAMLAKNDTMNRMLKALWFSTCSMEASNIRLIPTRPASDFGLRGLLQIATTHRMSYV